MFASLATGNAVIVKPHPTGILPMALSVRVARRVLAEAGFDPNLVTLAVDSPEAPLGMRLVKHPGTAIVDFTGSARFGAWVEQNAHPALSYTETSGVNTVVLESMDDLEPVARSLATTMNLFSAQMCTSPQNIYVPRGGVAVGGRRSSVDEVCDALVAAFRAVVAEPKRAASILATVQSPATLDLVERMRDSGRRRGAVLLDSAPYAHPDFPAARTATPLLLRVAPDARDLYCEERFGPIGFVIETDDAASALESATADVRAAGGITAFVYSQRRRFPGRGRSRLCDGGSATDVQPHRRDAAQFRGLLQRLPRHRPECRRQRHADGRGVRRGPLSHCTIAASRRVNATPVARHAATGGIGLLVQVTRNCKEIVPPGETAMTMIRTMVTRCLMAAAGAAAIAPPALAQEV